MAAPGTKCQQAGAPPPSLDLAAGLSHSSSLRSALSDPWKKTSLHAAGEHIPVGERICV